MTRAVLAALVLAGALLLAQGPPGDGAVVALSPRWAMNGYGDQKIVTDAEIADDHGGRHLITVDGGRIGGVELHVSDAPTLHQGQRVWIRGSARAYKVKGVQKVDLAWSGFSTALDVFRDGVRILSGTPNDGAQTDDLGKRGSGTYQYRVCASGLSSPCADAVAVF